MFTKLLRGILTFMMIVLVLVALGAGVVAGKESSFFAGLITFAMIVGVGLVTLCGMGVLVEISENINDMAFYLKGIRYSKMIEAPVELLGNSTSSANVNTTNTNNSNMKLINPSHAGEWRCPKCDTKNAANAVMCKGCGASKTK